MAGLFPSTDQMEASAPPSYGGNLFGENNPAQLAAQKAMIQRAMALQQAQLSPEQNGAFMANQAAGQFGGALGGLMKPPDPEQAELAKIKQATDAEAQQMGIVDEVQYLKLAASNLLKAGKYEYALKARDKVEELSTKDAKRKLTEAQAAEAGSVAAKNNQGTLEAYGKQPYETAVAKMKAEMTDPASKKALAEAEQIMKEGTWTDKKFGAEIDKLHAEANKLNTEAITSKTTIDRETLNEQAARLVEFVRLKRAKGEPVHPADEQAIADITRILAQAPQATIQSEIAKTMAAQNAGKTPVQTKGASKVVTSTSKSGKPIVSSDGGKTWQYR
jgi:hypothetical protein